jgi:hypothetical protein
MNKQDREAKLKTIQTKIDKDVSELQTLQERIACVQKHASLLRADYGRLKHAGQKKFQFNISFSAILTEDDIFQEDPTPENPTVADVEKEIDSVHQITSILYDGKYCAFIEEYNLVPQNDADFSAFTILEVPEEEIENNE